MSLSIYTYSNPYDINNEPYWDSIKNSAHFCVSQTMVNGLEAIYPELRHGYLATVESLVKTLYPEWNDTKTYIKQYAAITNILEQLENAPYQGSDDEKQKVLRALKFDKTYILDGIRLLSEMDIILKNIKTKNLTDEQKYLVAVYKKVLEGEYKSLFSMKASFSEESIEQAIRRALQTTEDRRDKGTVVFHGIHQFTPAILRTIEQVAKYRRVVMLFNYQEQYREIYQTWLDVYSCFDLTIKSQLDYEFRPNTLLSASYRSNLLADTLARLVNGELIEKCEELSQIKVLEFDNITEFSGYVAKIYEEARKSCDEDEKRGRRSVLSYMKEQFYAAENSVNDILKVYFPEQFKERHFLAYPIGHFFVAVINMWDSQKGGINIQDLSDVAECLYSGALPEKRPGTLITAFNTTKNYFDREKVTTIEGIIELLAELSRRKRDAEEKNSEKSLRRLGYFDITQEEIADLAEALRTLDKITKFFYQDFESDKNDFRNFYEKVRRFVEEQILPGVDTEEEFRGIITRLLVRLEEMDGEDIPSTFDCLKETMSYYLKQTSREDNSAHWIVRDFQQIDGDILQSSKQEGEIVYHFACVSDSDMNVKREDLFPWPLNTDFFEKAYDLLDWKYQVYVKSKKEFKHFKRYALIYGLEFNRCDFKISYIKNSNDRENEFYYLFKLLGIESDKYSHLFGTNKEIKTISMMVEQQNNRYFPMDYYRKKICAYKFALESVIEGDTHYKDHFLQRKYYEVLLVNRVRRNLVRQINSEDILDRELKKEADKLGKYFRFVIDSERMDIISSARNYIKSEILKNGRIKRFPELSRQDKDRMEKKEAFLLLRLENDDRENILNGKFEVSLIETEKILSQETLKGEMYEKSRDLWCQWCAGREICLESYKAAAGD